MPSEIIGFFSEAQASRLTGVSKRQLAYWDSTDFFHPAFDDGAGGGGPFRRIYSFRDLIELRVLDQLRNQYKIPMDHLREVRRRLSKIPEKRWNSQRLWVVNKEVVWENPRLGIKEGFVSKQHVLDFSLRIVLSGMREKVAELNSRSDKIGQIARDRYVGQNQPVLAGTRISVAAIKSFAGAGYSETQILKEYPGLTETDVRAALAYDPATSISTAA